MIARLKDDMGLPLDVAKRRANKVFTRVYLGETGFHEYFQIRVPLKGSVMEQIFLDDFWWGLPPLL